MLIEIILCVIAITPYVIIFMFFNHFQYIINTMSDINEFFSDVVDTLAEAVDQSNKRLIKLLIKFMMNITNNLQKQLKKTKYLIRKI